MEDMRPDKYVVEKMKTSTIFPDTLNSAQGGKSLYLYSTIREVFSSGVMAQSYERVILMCRACSDHTQVRFSQVIVGFFSFAIFFFLAIFLFDFNLLICILSGVCSGRPEVADSGRSELPRHWHPHII